MTDPTPHTTAGARGLLLTASLAVNLFLAALIGAHVWFGPPHGPGRWLGHWHGDGREAGPDLGRDFGREGARMGHGMHHGPDAETVAALTAALKDSREETAAIMRRVSRGRHDLARTLTSEPFEAQAFEQYATALLADLGAAQTKIIPAVAKAAAAAKPSDRKALIPLALNPGAVLRITAQPGDPPYADKQP